MKRYATQQLVQLIIVIVGISLLSFAILHVIGDPVLLLLPQNAGREEFERYRRLLGLDQPLWIQYWKFASRAILGDFGKSWYADTPAFTLVVERMPATIYLTFAGLGVGLVIALPLGILAALKRHSLVDNICTMLAVAGQAMPLFWLGIMLIIILAVRLRVLPASGYGTWQHFVMPSFCLGAFLAPVTMRLVRSGVIEVMNMEYIKTARAKGVAEHLVVAKHAFRNACIPVITVLGLQFGQLLGGAIVTETVFAWPGVATLTVESIRNQDFPVVQCAVVMLALIIVAVNLLVDLIVGVIDPRIRVSGVSSTELTLERAPAAAAGAGAARVTLRRLWRLKWGLMAAVVMLAIGVVTVLAPWVAPDDPLNVNIRHRLAPPAWMEGGASDHLLGTDQVGRDLLARVIYGGRVSLVIGVSAVLISATLGVLLGLTAGYFGRRADWTIMTLVNIMLTFPFVLLALAVIAVLGPSLLNMIIVLGVADWPLYARVIRAETLSTRERDFVVAGRALGMSHARVIFRQILPNLVSVIVVIATLQVARVIILESFLSFLGLGVQPPTPAWGNMLGEGRVYMLNSWWIAAFPGLAIFVTTLAINLIGNALRDWLDPHMNL